VVIDLDALKDYQVERGTGQVRVRIGTERTGFAAWSSNTVTPPVAVAERSAPPPAPPVTGGPEKAAPSPRRRWGHPCPSRSYLAAHRSEAAQSQAARHHCAVGQRQHRGRRRGLRGVQRPHHHLGKDIKGNVHRRIKNQPVGPRVERRAGIRKAWR